MHRRTTAIFKSVYVRMVRPHWGDFKPCFPGNILGLGAFAFAEPPTTDRSTLPAVLLNPSLAIGSSAIGGFQWVPRALSPFLTINLHIHKWFLQAHTSYPFPPQEKIEKSEKKDLLPFADRVASSPRSGAPPSK